MSRGETSSPTPRDFLKCFSTPEGKRIIRHLRRMYVHTRTYVKGDTHDTAFREGRRDLVLTISSQIEQAQKKPIDDEGEENG